MVEGAIHKFYQFARTLFFLGTVEATGFKNIDQVAYLDGLDVVNLLLRFVFLHIGTVLQIFDELGLINFQKASKGQTAEQLTGGTTTIANFKDLFHSLIFKNKRRGMINRIYE